MAEEDQGFVVILNVFACKLCSETFSSKEEKERHERRHEKRWVRLRKGDIFMMKCTVCQLEFEDSSQEELLQHENSHSSRGQAVISLQFSGDGSNKLEPVFSCKACPMTFNEPEEYRQHSFDQHKRTCPKCAYTSKNGPGLVAHMSSCCGQPTCPKCAKKFKSYNELQSHLMSHEKLACPHCSSAYFTTERALKGHMLKAHKGLCQKQEKVASLRHWTLGQERGQKRSGQKDELTCDKCDVLFPSSKSLRGHFGFKQVATYTLESSHRYNCAICSIKFNQWKDFHTHDRKYHKDRQSCEPCKLFFRSKKDLEAHMACAHRPEAKKIRLVQTVQTEEISSPVYEDVVIDLETQDNNVHSEAKKKQCSKCYLKFKTLQELNKHFEIHNQRTAISTVDCAPSLSESATNTLQSVVKIEENDIECIEWN